jgi:hypothetical protein
VVRETLVLRRPIHGRRLLLKKGSMMRRLAAVTAAALLSGVGLSAGEASARAHSTAHNPFRLTVRLMGGLHLKRVDAKTGDTHVTYLFCTATTSGSGPTTIHGLGGLKDSTSACEELAAVNGDLDALSVHPTWLPPAIVAPVDVVAHGTWEGAKVAWSHEYTNSGWLARATGDVFAF